MIPCSTFVAMMLNVMEKNEKETEEEREYKKSTVEAEEESQTRVKGYRVLGSEKRSRRAERRKLGKKAVAAECDKF